MEQVQREQTKNMGSVPLMGIGRRQRFARAASGATAVRRCRRMRSDAGENCRINRPCGAAQAAPPHAPAINRITALKVAFSDAVTMLGSIPTPCSTWLDESWIST